MSSKRTGKRVMGWRQQLNTDVFHAAFGLLKSRKFLKGCRVPPIKSGGGERPRLEAG